MSSLMDEMMAEFGVPLVEEFLGEPGGVGYLHPDGSLGGTFDAAIGGERGVEILVGESRSWKRMRTVNFFRQDGLPFWVENAAVGTFEIAGVEYAFDSLVSQTENFAVVELVRIGAIEKTRPEYRRK